MTEEQRDAVAEAALRHPVRAALMELIGVRGTVTSAQAAEALGGSTGLYSFHLRQLARYGLIEEAPAGRGRVRPWRLATAEPTPDAASSAATDLDGLARGLEDESYRRWQAQRDRAPARWRRDEAFSQVLYLTPAELTEMGSAIRDLISRYRRREDRPATRPPGAAPVAVVARLFPLLEPDALESGPAQPDPPEPDAEA
ncbi:winged helix-turn-helix domain-containing protein [Planosporangium mesophilum]|uniref:Transcriptional regulator n=1 Tax=Planosporangium mesophilum TaxID=689768 RepID=A0A8J3TCE8_9ACTN|nr:helix-turn-helix domain-containing protein [Planosporangium mesophilum]GII22936.1 transcriptional regulator [Planosporangium mesophilum]